MKSNYYLCKAVSSIGGILLYLSQSEDIFVFHLNKLTQNNSNLLGTLAEFIPYGESVYSQMVTRIISIWNKAHKYLDHNQLGSRILNSILSIDPEC